MPDVGRCNGMGTRRGATPWVGPQGWYERDEGRGLNSAEMNLELIEEHQAENLVFAQRNYLYILLEATPAYVIVPIAKVPRTKYDSCQYWNRREAQGASADPGHVTDTSVRPNIVHSPSWDTGHHESGRPHA